MKNTSTSAKSASSTRPARRGDLQSRIARHALELWQRYGRPVGQEAQIWIEAASDILIEEDKLPGLHSSHA